MAQKLLLQRRVKVFSQNKSKFKQKFIQLNESVRPDFLTFLCCFERTAVASQLMWA